MKTKKYRFLLAALLMLCLTSSINASKFDGTVKLGWVFVDDDELSSMAVNQPTYNLYEGAAISLERFNYRFDNGTRVYGNLNNITLNNRDLFTGITKSGSFGITLHDNQYRRTYSVDGDKFTRRNRTSGQLWITPLKHLKLFGGYGITNKHGEMAELFDPLASAPVHTVDYKHTFYNVGARLSHDRSFAQFELRRSDFEDELNTVNDRESSRYKVVAGTPLPGLEQIHLKSGYQHYTYELTSMTDTLTSNTFWMGTNWYNKQGYHLKYSFIFDRARRSRDLTATDNLTNAFYAGRTWVGKGGITLGYQTHTNDDIVNDIRTNSFFFSGWLRPSPKLTLKGGYGSSNRDDRDNSTLTGNQDRSKHYLSVKYKVPSGWVKSRFGYHKRTNDDIGSSAEFLTITPSLYLSNEKFGHLNATYSYSDGKYENSGGLFDFTEHVFNGDLTSRLHANHIRFGIGGTYTRGTQDVDVESFVVRLSSTYAFAGNHELELKYSAHNFDNLADVSVPYTQFYTANVIEINLRKMF